MKTRLDFTISSNAPEACAFIPGVASMTTIDHRARGVIAETLDQEIADDLMVKTREVCFAGGRIRQARREAAEKAREDAQKAVADLPIIRVMSGVLEWLATRLGAR